MATLAQRISDFVSAVGSDIKAIYSRVIPAGGSVGQALRKNSATDFDFSWQDMVATNVANSWTAEQTFKDVKSTDFNIEDVAGFQINPANGEKQTVTLTANRTPVTTNFQNGHMILLGINRGGVFNINWATVNVIWNKKGGGAAEPTLSPAGYTWIILWKLGGQIYGAEVGSP